MASWQEHSAHAQTHTAETIQIKRVDEQPFDISSFFTQGFELVKERPAETIGLGLVFIVAQVAIQMSVAIMQALGMGLLRWFLQAMDIHSLNTIQLITSGVEVATRIMGNAIMTTVNIVVSGMLYIMWLRLIRGQNFSVENLFEIKRFIIPLFLSGLLVGAATTVGTMACIIPGFIISFGLFFTSLVVLDTGLGAIEAVKACWKLTTGHKLNIFIFCLVAFFLNAAGALMCGLGLLVTIPVSLGASVFFYNSIAHPHNAYLKPEEMNTTQHVNHHTSVPPM